jgi:predicted Rossmann fold nucleotide-binding protein DprA/Smf involved in DNA uptake
MKTLSDQLEAVSKFLVNLSKQVEKIGKQIEKRQTPKKAQKAKSKPVKAKPAKKPGTQKTAVKQTPFIESVYDVVKKSKKGVDLATLKEKTGLESKQISNALYKLSKRGMIRSVSRGVYSKK